MKKIALPSLLIILFLSGLLLVLLLTNKPSVQTSDATDEVAPVLLKSDEEDDFDVFREFGNSKQIKDSGGDVFKVESVSVNPQTTDSRPLNAPYTIYKNALAKGWEDASVGANVNFKGFPAYDGQTAIIANIKSGGGAVYLKAPQPIQVKNHNLIRFWISGGVTGGQQLSLSLVNEQEVALKSIAIRSPYANNWRQIDILIEELGAPTAIRGIIIKDALGEAQPPFYIDELAFVDDPLAALINNTDPDGPQLSVSSNTITHAISPHIYGMNFAKESVARELDLPVNRWGGNAVSRYNYLEDATNTGNNWYFENIPPRFDNPDLPTGSSADKFVQQNNRSKTDTFITIPMVGHVARGDYSCGFSIEKFGEQVEMDEEYRPDCGNGVTVEGDTIRGGNPADTSIVADPVFAQNWMRHLIGRFGTAGTEKGVNFYGLGNEPNLWSETHRDLHPNPMTTDELMAKTFAYAPAIKQVDPNAKILGPNVWGWSSYFWAGIDYANGNDPLVSAPDQAAHGGIPLVAYYLQQMAAYEQQTGTRLLDYLNLHYYPQAVGVAFVGSGGDNDTTKALRLRTTRSLWDREYVDESWIEGPVFLIPRMRDWVNQYYPGTKLAIGEYNFGAMDNINGAVTQADVLGIFGREQLDLATLWAPPGQKEPGMYAFRMYLNYDGRHAKFGDQSVTAVSDNQDQMSIYAARRSSDNALTVMIINKTNVVLTSEVFLEGFSDGQTARAYQYSSENTGAIERLDEQVIENGRLINSFPPSSITLFEFK